VERRPGLIALTGKRSSTKGTACSKLFVELQKVILLLEMTHSNQFDLTSWAIAQQKDYGEREGGDATLEKLATRFDPAGVGLSGLAVDSLFHSHPRMVPIVAFGGGVGWRSSKRYERWRDLLIRSGVIPPESGNGVLVRFLINAKHWVPHPYCPPLFCLADFGNFSNYITPHREAFDLCREWQLENSIHITSAVRRRLKHLPDSIGASYRCYNQADYAEIAFCCEPPNKPNIELKTPWKREHAMFSLIANDFPDSCREYSPSWLGAQRIDVFVPSLNVGFEFQGEQHSRPIEFFGGEEGFRRNNERDKRKRELCRRNGVILIEWQYYEAIDEARLRSKLAEHDIRY
jgi:hypothetical protein